MRTALSPDYHALKAFWRFLTERWFSHIPIATESSPAKLLEQLELSSPSKATAGLRMAVNDLIEMSSHMAPAEVTALDSELAEAGLLTLTQVRGRYSKRLQSVLKRGTVRTEVEYYLLRGVATDLSSGLTEQDRLKAEQLCSEFESKASQRGKHAA